MKSAHIYSDMHPKSISKLVNHTVLFYDNTTINKEKWKKKSNETREEKRNGERRTFRKNVK